MRIKRFEAPDNKTALELIKKEMGENAIILSSRSIPRERSGAGMKGAGRPWVEIVAAMDYEQPSPPERVAPPPVPAARREAPAGDQAGKDAYDYRTIRRPLRTQPLAAPAAETAARRGFSPAEIAVQEGTAEVESINFEAHDMRLRFADLVQGRSAPPPKKMAPRKDSARPEVDEVARWRDEMLERIRIKPLELGSGKGPTIIALVGPTGVGKTTTAAKMAAWFSLRQEARVMLLSMDCYRIGATDQLRTYARIMRLPCEIALRKKDLAQAIASHQDKDLIVVDTAGKSPYDPQHIAELKEWFAPYRAIAPYLVVSATTKKEDLAHLFSTYAALPLAGLILTKLDETRAYASLCQQIAAVDTPLAYLATGQRVPEDFLAASRSFLDNFFRQGWSAVTPDLRLKARV